MAGGPQSRTMLSRAKRQREARLRPFTDYSRRQRPRFNRAISLDAAPSDYYYAPHPSSFQHQESKLYQRRRANTETQSSTESLDSVGGGGRKRGHRKRNQRQVDLKVSFGDIGKSSIRTQNVQSAALFTTAKPTSTVHTVTSDPHLITASSPPFDSFDEVSPPCIPDDLPLPPLPVMTPIVTPTRSEYSSITDNIDTSCVNYGSPSGSPQTPRHNFVPLESRDAEPSGASRPHTAPMERKNSSKAADDRLKSAEESEHDQMEQIIRKRIRQISLTESDSLGDMAKHVMNDIDLKEEEDDEKLSTAYFSGDEATSSAVDATSSGLKSVKSEPNFHYVFSLPLFDNEEYQAIDEESTAENMEDTNSVT
jgi:hypothetical protein